MDLQEFWSLESALLVLVAAQFIHYLRRHGLTLPIACILMPIA